MAQKRVNLDQGTFSCSICLDLLRDPVTLACGHSYCMDCITTHWDGEDPEQIYSCPQCRHLFTPRPVLVKSTMLADLVEELKKPELQAAPAGPEDVACDYCTGSKRKASKSCLVCLTSYCEKHLQPHYSVVPLKKHKLVEPSKNLEKKICSHHGEVMNLFCRTDQQCICYLCSVDEHKGHDTVSAEAERTEKQRELEESLKYIQEKKQEKEKYSCLLEKERNAIHLSANKAVEKSEKAFSELICLLQKISSDLTQQLRAREETEVERVHALSQKLVWDIPELRCKMKMLQHICKTEDHIRFLQNYICPWPPLSEAKLSTNFDVGPLTYFEEVTAAVTAAVSQARSKLQDVLRETWTDLSLQETKVDIVLPPPELQTRADFLKHSREITLDPNTNHTRIELSEGNRKGTLFLASRSKPNPDRFTGYTYKAMSAEGLTGRCYWEVENGAKSLGVSAVYKDISRDGMNLRSEKSWALSCGKNNYLFWHQNAYTHLPSDIQSSRVGVYLDHSAGVLSFYDVSETNTMTLLHRVETTFTQPLHAAIGFWEMGDTAEFVKPK